MSLNGTPAPLDLAGLRAWAIAYVDLSQGYVGRLVSETSAGVTLGRAYALLGGYQVGPSGIGRQMLCAPIEMLGNVRSWTGRPISTLHLDTLDEADFKQMGENLIRAIDLAEKIRTGIRSQRAGVVLAPAGIKLPPMRGA